MLLFCQTVWELHIRCYATPLNWILCTFVFGVSKDLSGKKETLHMLVDEEWVICSLFLFPAFPQCTTFCVCSGFLLIIDEDK